MDSLTYFKSKLDAEEYAKLIKLDTIPELLEKGRERFCSLPAIAYGEAAISYEALYRDVARTRGYLQALSLPAGAHVGLLLRNSYDFVRLFLALSSAGYVAVLLPVTTPAKELPALLQRFDVAFLFYEEALAELTAGLSEAMPRIEARSASADSEAPMCGSIKKGTPAAIVFSAGTTGRQKGALLSHGALLRGAHNGAYGLKKSFQETYLLLVPLTHVFGLIRNLLTALYTGSLLCINTDMRALFSDLTRYRPTTLVLVPSLAGMLYQFTTKLGPEALGGRLRVIICGGAAVPPDLIRAYDAIGVALLPGYGLTETANLVSGNGDYLARPTSVGVPYPEQEVRIVEGELQVRGDHVLLEYYKDPEETAAAFTDGWFRTGDLAHMDEDGFLYIVGRLKNLIITENGENVSPEELEELINELPLVKDCMVKEDKNRYNRKIIAVEILPDAETAAQMQVLDMPAAIKQGVNRINRELPLHKQIQRVTLREEDFPRNASLKIIRPRVEV